MAKKTAAEYVAMFRKARDFDPDRFNEYQENLAFYEGQQHLLSRYQTVKPWVVDINTPYASDAINMRVSSLMANDYIGEIEPLSPDDVEKIELLNNVYQNQWNELNMDKFINEAILRAAIVREAYIHVIYDSEQVKGATNRLRQGSLEAYFIDPASMLIDPNALEFRDADYIIVVERITPKKAEFKYDYKQESEHMGSSFTPEDRGEIAIDADYNTEQETVLTKFTVYEKTKKGIDRTILIENKIVMDTKTMPIKQFPIAQLRWEKRQKSPYAISLMDRVLPLQKSVNSIESAITNTALAYAAPSFVVRADAGIDPQAVAMVAGAPGVVFKVNGDPSTAIKTLVNNAIDKEMLNVKKSNEETIYKISGVTQEFKGDLGTSGNTSGGSDKAISRAKIIEQKFLVNLEEFVEDLTGILIEFITKVFSGKTIYSRSPKKADGKFDFNQLEIPKEGMEDLEYSFYVNLDVKTPYSKEKEKALIQELFTIERQYDAPIKTINIQDIIKTYDLTNSQELVERYEQLSQRDSKAKAQIITQFVYVTSQAGVNAEMISQGINEIIIGKETPTVDQIMQQLELAEKQKQMQQQQMQQQNTNAMVERENAMAAGGGAPQPEMQAQPQAQQQAQVDPAQVEAAIQQMVQQGMQPEQIIQQLIQMGVPEEVIQQLTSGAPQQQQI